MLALYHSGLESQHENNDLTVRAAKIYLGANTIIPQQKPNTPKKGATRQQWRYFK